MLNRPPNLRTQKNLKTEARASFGSAGAPAKRFRFAPPPKFRIFTAHATNRDSTSKAPLDYFCPAYVPLARTEC